MTEMNENQEASRKGSTEEEPQVYAVEKDLSGWKFSRREFVAAAAAAAATATVVAGAAANKSVREASEGDGSFAEAISLALIAPAMRVVGFGESFTEVWQFTNQSETTWCRGASLHFADPDHLQVAESVAVPDIPPGESVDVRVDMVAPNESGTYQSNWHLKAAGNTVPVSFGTFDLDADCIVESAHYYAPNFDYTWTVNNPDTSADATKVHFSQLTLGSGDYVRLKDSTGATRRTFYSYSNYIDYWSTPIPGTEVQVQLDTNSYSEAWGFCLDRLRSVRNVYMPMVLKQPTPTPTYTPCPCDYDCGCDYVHYWYPD